LHYLEQWEMTGYPYSVPVTGDILPWDDDLVECGELGRVSDWLIRSGTGKSLSKHSLQGQIGVYKYRRRIPLIEIYKLEHYI
jgi:hypothetical protein